MSVSGSLATRLARGRVLGLSAVSDVLAASGTSTSSAAPCGNFMVCLKAALSSLLARRLVAASVASAVAVLRVRLKLADALRAVSG